MADPNDIATRSVACWNERDPARRRALVAALWSEGATSRDPMMDAEGHDGIAALIEGVPARFHSLRFVPTCRADGFAEVVRSSWTFGPEGAAAPIAGTDVALLDEAGRPRAVTDFLDRVPDVA
jgi:hypothetical protein